MTYQTGDRVLHHATGQIGHIHTWHGVVVLMKLQDGSTLKANINEICYQPDREAIERGKAGILAAKGLHRESGDGPNMAEIKAALIRLDVFNEIPEMGYKVLVETSRSGELTRIHWEKISTIESRCLTKKPKTE